jgi:hypothetical protein
MKTEMGWGLALGPGGLGLSRILGNRGAREAPVRIRRPRRCVPHASDPTADDVRLRCGRGAFNARLTGVCMVRISCARSWARNSALFRGAHGMGVFAKSG